jgi:hypothetical protein
MPTITRILKGSPNSGSEECLHTSASGAVTEATSRENLFDSGSCKICGEICSTVLYQST